MLLKMIHETELTYSAPISETVMELRMAPRQVEDQQRLSFALALGPPASVMHHFDWLGNSVHAFAVNDMHQRVRIVATNGQPAAARIGG
jgi:transglutaminase-like putative cysteine protease